MGREDQRGSGRQADALLVLRLPVENTILQMTAVVAGLVRKRLMYRDLIAETGGRRLAFQVGQNVRWTGRRAYCFRFAQPEPPKAPTPNNNTHSKKFSMSDALPEKTSIAVTPRAVRAPTVT